MTTWNRQFQPASPAQVEQFEERIGTSLPSDYREYLLTQNGGSPSDYLGFRIPALSDDKNVVLLGAMYGIGNQGSGVDLVTQYQDLNDVVPHSYIPIGEDPGGNLLLLAIQGPSRGHLLFWDRVGLFAKQKEQNLFPIADHINQFLESLLVMRDV